MLLKGVFKRRVWFGRYEFRTKSGEEWNAFWDGTPEFDSVEYDLLCDPSSVNPKSTVFVIEVVGRTRLKPGEDDRLRRLFPSGPPRDVKFPSAEEEWESLVYDSPVPCNVVTLEKFLGEDHPLVDEAFVWKSLYELTKRKRRVWLDMNDLTSLRHECPDGEIIKRMLSKGKLKRKDDCLAIGWAADQAETWTKPSILTDREGTGYCTIPGLSEYECDTDAAIDECLESRRIAATMLPWTGWNRIPRSRRPCRSTKERFSRLPDKERILFDTPGGGGGGANDRWVLDARTGIPYFYAATNRTVWITNGKGKRLEFSRDRFTRTFESLRDCSYEKLLKMADGSVRYVGLATNDDTCDRWITEACRVAKETVFLL